jgi:hypothetical protein
VAKSFVGSNENSFRPLMARSSNALPNRGLTEQLTPDYRIEFAEFKKNLRFFSKKNRHDRKECGQGLA